MQGMPTTFSSLRTSLHTIALLSSAAAVLGWDEQTYLPSKAAPIRGEMSAALAEHVHSLLTDPELHRLVQDLADQADTMSEQEQAAVRETLRDVERACKLPSDFVRLLSETASEGYAAWLQATQRSDYSIFLPVLTRLVDLKRQEAELYGYENHPYDALLEDYEPGLWTAAVREMFSALKDPLVILLRKIQASPVMAEPTVVQGTFPEARQREFLLMIAQTLGFDLEAGRLDSTQHPFATGFHPTDVRITTHFDERDLTKALLSTIHELGHGMYEQGLPADWYGTPLGEAVSFGVHESQSRLWENQVGRSKAFWQYAYPLLQSRFPSPFATLPFDDFYRAINHVAPGLIRVDADEVTYNLHIILRFELETALLEGTLKTEELPGAWNEKMKQYFGLEVPDDAHGVLQDVHWSSGSFGYFPSYTLGNLYAAQLFAAAENGIPELSTGIARGEFRPLLSWLRENVHRYGRFYKPAELIRHATGSDPDPSFYLAYLQEKYGNLYGF